MNAKAADCWTGALSRAVTSAGFWPIDPSIRFLNHGSFGCCPKAVLDHQHEIRRRMERQPVQFFVRDLESLLDQARRALAGFLGSLPRNLCFVPNATSGLNAVLRSYPFHRGDEIIVTNHEYQASRNAADFVAGGTGARVVEARIPFPIRNAGGGLDEVLAAVSPRTRLVLIDHVTSQTGLIFPVEKLVRALSQRGIDALIDGAHAPGMIDLDLERLEAAFYVGNCHKWLCAPKGAGFLYIRPDRHSWIRPLAISHGASATRKDRPRHLLEFDWTGTSDPSPLLCIPTAIETLAEAGGGWSRIRERNRGLAVAARREICRALEIEWPSPEGMIGSLASMPIPPAAAESPPSSPLYSDPLQEQLLRVHRIEVPLIPWPKPPHRLVRISCQLYNSLPQYHALASALRDVFGGLGSRG